MREDAEKIASETAKIIDGIHDRWEKEDVQIIASMYDDSLIVLPLYRSAIVVLPGEERGEYVLKLHHDPGWMGEDSTPETFSNHCGEFRIYGSRSGIDFVYEEAPCGDAAAWITGPVGHYIDCPHTNEELAEMWLPDEQWPGTVKATAKVCRKCFGKQLQPCWCNKPSQHRGAE